MMNMHENAVYTYKYLVAPHINCILYLSDFFYVAVRCVFTFYICVLFKKPI